MISGKFHGTIAPTTPSGSRVISASASRAGGRDFVVNLVDRFAHTTECSAPSPGTSTSRLSRDGLAHVERLEQRELLRYACVISSANRSSTFLRFAGGWLCPAALAKAARAGCHGSVDVLACPRPPRARAACPVAGLTRVKGGSGGGVDIAAADEGLRAEGRASGRGRARKSYSGFALMRTANLQKLGGVLALMISHGSRPTLRKRCGKLAREIIRLTRPQHARSARQRQLDAPAARRRRPPRPDARASPHPSPPRARSVRAAR